MDFLVTLLIVLLSMALGLASAHGMLQLMFAAMARAPGAPRRHSPAKRRVGS
jgi:hypothetical protein